MDMFSAFISSFATILQPEVLAYMISGFLIGTFFGAMPGLTSVLAIALLLPITYSLDVVSALVMCSSIFMAGMYSGSITAITINIPGAPSSVMTAVEGNALMKKGYGANALGHAALGSMVGGVIGVLLLVCLAPVTAKLSLYIQTPGKFSLILFSLIVIVISHKKFIIRAAIASLMGIMIASVGIDVMQPISRFDFGTEALMEGIDMMPLIIGVFAISEIIYQTQVGKMRLDVGDAAKQIKRRDFFPKLSEIKTIGLWTYLKSSVIGYMVGVLPGAGGSVAAFISYADAKRRSKNKEEYGSGSREGIVAAESANNSMCGGAFVPMLVFGIPGDPTTAIVLGVLMILNSDNKCDTANQV
ncbi:tripartite tricarboxylate transporter permease [Marinomonas foliarum]|uniref:Tripartite tricarboxylate transporter TctA family protein n=1 Tax=Marinomonas foliarum TaxID=491950 RepID=A0A368ZPB8_9GAMM|nr:tripartite tricarboxylate transporter permease [Marinomonas foliarum]RCW97227.1 tripartite tricarboxylate transporter TctA family protein [Marinomonas foliarum]